MPTILRTPPLRPLTVATLHGLPPEPDHVVALLDDGGHRYPDHEADTWRELHPLPDPHRVRPADMPVLADGVDLAGWARAYGSDSVRPLTLSGGQLSLLAEAEACVRRDGEALNLERAITAQAELQDVCLRVHYAHDLHADEDPHTACVFDAPTHRFYLLSKKPR